MQRTSQNTLRISEKFPSLLRSHQPPRKYDIRRRSRVFPWLPHSASIRPWSRQLKSYLPASGGFHAPWKSPEDTHSALLCACAAKVHVLLITFVCVTEHLNAFVNSFHKDYKAQPPVFAEDDRAVWDEHLPALCRLPDFNLFVSALKCHTRGQWSEMRIGHKGCRTR